MKHIFFPFLFLGFFMQAQEELKFEKRFVDCENQWVVTPKTDDGVYLYGYVYFDNKEGLTFDLGGILNVEPNNKYSAVKKTTKDRMIDRLKPSNAKVALLPLSVLKEIKEEENPSWIVGFKADPTTADYFFKRGDLFNAWGEFEKALTYLEKAFKINPKYKGLETEMAYSYNAQKQFDKSIEILKIGLQNQAGDCYLFKELAFAQINLKLFDDVAETYKKQTEICQQDGFKSEIAFNITYAYFMLMDKPNFLKWSLEVKKWIKPESQMAQYLASMEKQIAQ